MSLAESLDSMSINARYRKYKPAVKLKGNSKLWYGRHVGSCDALWHHVTCLGGIMRWTVWLKYMWNGRRKCGPQHTSSSIGKLCVCVCVRVCVCVCIYNTLIEWSFWLPYLVFVVLEYFTCYCICAYNFTIVKFTFVGYLFIGSCLHLILRNTKRKY